MDVGGLTDGWTGQTWQTNTAHRRGWQAGKAGRQTGTQGQAGGRNDRLTCLSDGTESSGPDQWTVQSDSGWDPTDDPVPTEKPGKRRNLANRQTWLVDADLAGGCRQQTDPAWMDRASRWRTKLEDRTIRDLTWLPERTGHWPGQSDHLRLYILFTQLSTSIIIHL